MRRKLTLLLLLILVTGLSACSAISYYSQSVTGHMKVWTKRQDIDRLIANRATRPELKIQLRKILKMREFASRELQLPRNYSFKSYVDIKRKSIVWNVIAAPEFSTEPKKWCFLMMGCLNYIGYFSRDKAEVLAKKMKQQGYDVILGGVTAYSTLGWFSDPVLNTFVNRKDHDLAGLIFHELAHQVIYIKGDTTFNESFATAVELYGIEQWMKKRGTPEIARRYALHKQYETEFHKFILSYRKQLKVMYARKIPDSEKRLLKKKIIAQMQLDYKKRRKRWKGYSDYDQWMASGINNAKMAIFATYYRHVAAFSQLIRQKNGNMKEFFLAVKRLGAMDRAQREEVLNSLAIKRRRAQQQMGSSHFQLK